MSNNTISPYASSQLAPIDGSSIPTQTQIAAEFGGDAAAQLAAMVFLFSRERSRQSAEQRDQIELQIREFENKQVQKMHEGADASYDAAVWNSGGQLVSGGLSLVGSAVGGAPGDAIKATGQASQGASGFLAADDKLAADNLAADAEHADNQAGSYERSLETVNDDADDAKAMKDAVYEFLQTVQESKAEGDKALVNIRA